MEFKGKNILITGASSGIGREFAVQLHSLGANLLLLARREELLKEITFGFNELRPNSTEYIVADLSLNIELEEVLKELRARRIDILINNAGRGSFGEFHRLELEDEQNMVQLNSLAQLALVHTALKKQQQLKAEGESGLLGVIIISSVAGFSPVPFMSTYAASKAFNFIHGISLHHEYRSTGINVLTVCPGPVATEFGGVARVPGELTNIKRDKTEQVVKESLDAFKKQRAWIVVGRIGRIVGLSRFIPYNIKTALTKRMLLGSLRKDK
jgi:uncharacterized protein